MRILLTCNGYGTIIRRPDLTSKQWDALQNWYAEASEAGPQELTEAISLWPECRTDNGITFDEELACANGSSFRLHAWPENTREQLQAAVSWLRQRRDVVRFLVLMLKRHPVLTPANIELKITELKGDAI